MIIKPRERDAVLQSLRAGVVPRTGQHLIQVGRSRELETLIDDIDRLTHGGSSFRMVIGEYGAGKTFFLNLVRAVALEKRLVVIFADLNPDRRLHATAGQARSLFSELMRNASTRTKPDGSALPGIVEKFVATTLMDAKGTGQEPEAAIHEKLATLHEMVGGYNFAAVVSAYWRGFDEDNEQLKSDSLRWLRGEFSAKTEAKAALGVRTIIDDATYYDHLKLLAAFVRLSGFGGVLVCLDEMVNLYKLANTKSRNSNYEQLLRILNDSLQGTAVGLGFVLGGTPEFLFDTRRGLYSYPALQSRLAENTFAQNGLVDFTGPVVKLSALTPEDLFVLLTKLRDVYANGDSSKYLLPDEALPAFMAHCERRVGDAYFRTPRTTIMAFVSLLAILDQNPKAEWAALLGKVVIAKDDGASNDLAVETADDFTAFRL